MALRKRGLQRGENLWRQLRSWPNRSATTYEDACEAKAWVFQSLPIGFAGPEGLTVIGGCRNGSGLKVGWGGGSRRQVRLGSAVPRDR